jgi:hypothetical protein
VRRYREYGEEDHSASGQRMLTFYLH